MPATITHRFPRYIALPAVSRPGSSAAPAAKGAQAENTRRAGILASSSLAGLTLPDTDADKLYEPAGEVVVHFISDDARARATCRARCCW